MWDTSKDYRLMVALKSVELFRRTLETGSFRGQWKKKLALTTAGEIERTLQGILYSYLEPGELAGSPEIEGVMEKLDVIVEALGGEDWAMKFASEAGKDDREKVEENIARVRFFLNTIGNLKKRLMLGKIADPVIGVDILAGEVMSVGGHPGADKLQVCNVNIGGRALKVVTNDPDVREGDRVAVALLPPENFMGITSEGMFLGVEGVLRDVKGEPGEMPRGMPLEALNEARNLVEEFLKS
ncbi:hypothetical protein C7452_0391 [Methanothermobacter defluvii]|uniref:tRNA-binding domain-containing protein n=1 Tax=Methanothermobacter defluvii TaxID=49339 RepID=A0A371ND33_9EURY|nr:tRNA-binding protein [Methanothermobacter defluvii]MDI6842577.1 tRNA-binding protein [Methanothermobacter wolfeii]REE28382.1 hypothetical protein C7452_0391 [Methanothermobacter defluvii]